MNSLCNLPDRKLKMRMKTRLIDEKCVNYESIKRELKMRCIYECRCDVRLQSKTKEFTYLSYTVLVVELEHLKIETRFINDKFPNEMCEYGT
jgi:hypothetical protein